MYMKTFIFAILSLMSFNTFAFNDDPLELFNATKRMTGHVDLNWVVVEDASVTCQQESKKRGLGGWPYKVYACTFWNDGGVVNKCTIITSKYTNMHQVGHELRHCFQGAYHD